MAVARSGESIKSVSSDGKKIPARIPPRTDLRLSRVRTLSKICPDRGIRVSITSREQTLSMICWLESNRSSLI